MSFLAFLSVFKTRGAWYVAGGIALVFALLAWHFSSVHRAVLTERERVTAVYEQAAQEAAQAQVAQNEAAYATFAAKSDERAATIIYRDKEVVKYVKQNNERIKTAGDDCRVDDGFISVYNNDAGRSVKADD